MKRILRLFTLLLALLLLGAAPVHAEYIAAEHTKNTGSPYYIMVNRRMNTLTVYTLGEDGAYSVPERAMICSTGREGHATPLGTFSLTGYKTRWNRMLDGSYGQYCSQFKGNYLIHSVCYEKDDPATLLTEEYNLLGSVASLGCIRLQVGDAKWVFDNCPAGTRVTIYDGDVAGALGKPRRMVDEITEKLDNGWDPTDPREENPWRERFAQYIRLNLEQVTLRTGDSTAINLSAENLVLAGQTVWSSANPAVAVVDERGVVVGVSAGETEVSARCGGIRASCLVTVRGERLPFDDVLPGAWYYQDIRYAYEHNLLSGGSDRLFLPDEPVTLALAAQTLLRLSGEQPVADTPDSWYAGALVWAAERLNVTAAEDPQRSLSNLEFAQMLYRFDRNTAFSGAGASPETALNWAEQRGFLPGSSAQELEASLTRAQLAAVLCRYDRQRGTQRSVAYICLPTLEAMHIPCS